ncbi:MAG: GerMN domain-containing protein [Candidatus Cohnella colombiensis]|uniref:GerMN domain-containing protein n=1 Tax=Candidatus Cohnella colombiensis TaxID=3121368 RepID=A0AA95JGT1_9BACL|nr:MAG: GerMN domain-containing protein [Cohnella sp.]
MNRKMNRIIKRIMVVVTLLLLPLTAACSQNESAQKQMPALDPPPFSIESAMLDGSYVAQASANQEMLTVYLLDYNGYVAPMTLNITRSNSSNRELAEQALSWMTVDPKRADQLPEGFRGLIPAGTKVNTVVEDVKSGTITIDFAAPFPGMIAANERKLLEALVWTMTELPGVNEVNITVAGEKLKMLPLSKLPVYEVLTRSIGINVELVKGVEPARSMPVTLYFTAQSAQGEGYLVPVTRLVERTSNRAHTTLEQLIQGPSQKGMLHASLPSDITIEKLSQLADTVEVSLRDDALLPNVDMSSNMLEALVLTMTEATGAPLVRVVMNGNESFTDTDAKTYDQPVTRPVYINQLMQ